MRENYKEQKIYQGLSSKEAANLLKQYGENIVFKKRKIRPLIAFAKKFTNPLLIILVFSSIVSFFLGERTNALIILLMVFVSGLLEFINTYKSEKAVEKLVAKVITTVTVTRDGRQKEIPLSEIVPGDLVALSAGDIVPADCIILEANDFFLNQAALTGESFPVEKVAKPSDVISENASLESGYAVFMGTSVVTGYAKVLVKKTGAQTEFGRIAKELEETPPLTEFEIGIRKFGYFMLQLTFIMVSFVFVANALGHRGWLESFIFALAIAIGLTPELLPVIMSVSLSRGSVRMAKKEVIVKNLSSIHSLGSMNILCTDKTGTLTQDKIVLIKHLDGFGNESEKIFLYAYVSSIFHTGGKKPLENAIKEYRKPDVSGYKKIDEIPFDFTRKRDSVVAEKESKRILITKGAPEEIFKISNFYSKSDGDSRTFDFDAASQRIFENKFRELSADGFRVLALAVKEIDSSAKNVYKKEDEEKMTFLGFMAFLDPPKEGVKEAVDELEDLGIELKILTGDSEVLTKKICAEINIVCDKIMIGEELNRMSDEELSQKAKDITVFARVTPEQKERIILILKRNGNAVGYLGDGINDAPALRVADIGISVNNAVDVAKETADIILIQKSLRVLKDGVVEGRKTFQNIMKYIMMGLSSNFGNMFSMMGASLILPYLPMLPSQVLFNNFLYDVSQLSLSTDDVDDDDVKKPPRWDMSFIRKFMLILGPVSSIFDFLTFGALFYVFRFSESGFQTGWFLESIATQVFVIYVIRTKKIPFLQSWPSLLLFLNTLFVVFIAWITPLTPLGGLFRFKPLPAGLFWLLPEL